MYGMVGRIPSVSYLQINKNHVFHHLVLIFILLKFLIETPIYWQQRTLLSNLASEGDKGLQEKLRSWVTIDYL